MWYTMRQKLESEPRYLLSGYSCHMEGSSPGASRLGHRASPGGTSSCRMSTWRLLSVWGEGRTAHTFRAQAPRARRSPESLLPPSQLSRHLNCW